MKRDLCKAIAPDLASVGFKLDRKAYRFERKDGQRVLRFYVWLNGWPGSRHVSTSACIRFEEIETLFHRTSGFASDTHYGTDSLNYLIPSRLGEELVLSIRDKSEVEALAPELLLQFCEHAIPFYDQFQTVSSVDDALNRNPEEPCRFQPGLPWFRASTGVIAAHLAGNPQLYELARVYRGQVSELAGGFYLPVFDGLLKDLNIDFA